MATGIYGAIQQLVDLGLVDVVLPFIFIFTILFAILQKTKILGSEKGKPKVRLNSIFALTVALFFVNSEKGATILSSVSQKFILLVIVIVVVMIISGFLGFKSKFFGKLGYIILTIIILLIFGTSVGLIETQDLAQLVSWILTPTMLGVLAFILLSWYIIREPGKKGEVKSAAESKAVEPGKEKGKPPKGKQKVETEGKLKGVPYEELGKKELTGGKERKVWEP